MKPPALARRLAARWLIKRAVDLHVEGVEHVPASGPAILVARHYHHLYDAAAILACVPREVHVLVALDWLEGGLRLRLVRWLTDAARWPSVWRRGAGWRFNREGYNLSVRLLSEGRLLLIFPEAYPTIDPSGSHKSEPDELLPFDAGFLHLAERAGPHVPIVPVGVWYHARVGGEWSAWLRFGRPVYHGRSARRQRRSVLAAVQAEVHRLSSPPRG